MVPGKLSALRLAGGRHHLHPDKLGAHSRAGSEARGDGEHSGHGSAHSNSVFVAAADRVGTERGQPFVGQSLITSYTGWPIAGPASDTDEEIIYAEVNLSDARRKRNWNEYNQILRDRRLDVYEEMLGAPVEPGWY